MNDKKLYEITIRAARALSRIEMELDFEQFALIKLICIESEEKNKKWESGYRPYLEIVEK